VRAELEGLATFLAAQHAGPEEIRVLYDMIESDREYIGDPQKLSRANRRFHNQLHLASHNNFLIQQLQQVHRTYGIISQYIISCLMGVVRVHYRNTLILLMP
jgi:DNA-binding GntR family transcriptional regulator